MKFISKILIFLTLILGVFLITNTSLAEMVNIPGSSEIKDVSINIDSDAGDPLIFANKVGYSLFKTTKIILEGLLVIYIVYVGIMMIMSMGHNEEQLTNAKKQLWFAIIAIVFINIPGSIYNMFNSIDKGIGSKQGNSFSNNDSGNLFIDTYAFEYTFTNNIVGFFEVLLIAAAVVMLIIAGIKVLTSMGKEERLKEGKNKVLYSIIALVFAGIIEAWKIFAFEGSISKGMDIFENLANLALFFAGPTAIFFLTFAGYYYITANGDEEKVKKAKSIVINTLLATLILLAAYTFLLDLATL
ncbi:MAG: hypothetical protein PHH06_03080 [Candidatus Gracilibacteria bacterium]|nr:hypothetical protein [Candidatus Gracilibacteria bacterium]